MEPVTVTGWWIPNRFLNRGDGERGTVLREVSAVRSDCFLYGGIGGVAACDVTAGGRRRCGRARAVRSSFDLHVRQVLRLQGAFASLLFQELLDGHSSRFGHTLLHHYLYDLLLL